MISMTGFGYGEYQDDCQQAAIEIKSYNNKYLDIHVNVPQNLGSLEPRFREYLASRIRRGKVELTLRYRRLANELTFKVDTSAVVSFTDVLREIAAAAGIGAEIQLSHILAMEDLVQSKREIDPEEAWVALMPLVEQTFEKFMDSRVSEGEATEKSIAAHLSVFANAVQAIGERSGELETALQENIRSRFETVLGNRIDEDRVLAETAVLLVKFSIDEEISRLTSHLEAFRQTAAQIEPVGKKLDFLCQELNREINTVGSKSTIYEINRQVVEAKDALEKIREQLRNVE
ncbi:MAG: YicC family protein [Spirochaetales bacterium]|nr:YicC family protein [Spirochaetales bacterium]